MFTNNFVHLMRLFASAYSYKATESGFINTIGGSVKAGAAHLCEAGIKYWMGYAKCKAFPEDGRNTGDNCNGVFFGTDSTPATREDYKLKAPITTGLSITNATTVLEEHTAEGRYSLIASYSVANTTDAEINIYEVGLFVPISTSTNDTIYGATIDAVYPVLVNRTVLDVPINIQPGMRELITYKITFNQTLNVE